MVNIFQYLYDKKGKQIPLLFKLINKLPLNENDLIINGDLYLYHSKITSLPDNFTINGSLDIYKTEITSLPNNLTINGSLDISSSNITSLPDNLTVHGNLNISNSNIEFLPENIVVDRYLYCWNTPLANNIKNDISLLINYSKQVRRKIYFK